MNILPDLSGEAYFEPSDSYTSTLHLVECPECDGTGESYTDLSNPIPIRVKCEACNGKGRVLMRESEFKVWEEK